MGSTAAVADFARAVAGATWAAAVAAVAVPTEAAVRVLSPV